MTRRGLRPLLPAFAHWFGIMPWHIESDPPVLTVGETSAFIAWLTERLDQRDGD